MAGHPRYVLSVLAVLALLNGCTPCKEYVANGFKVGPNYGSPPAPVAKEWIDAGDKRVRTETDDLSKWWTAFNDPVLNSLICYAYKQNLTLRQAGFRVLEARAQLAIARGDLFPQTQTATGDFTRNQVSTQDANRNGSLKRFYSQWDLGFNLAWELDFWGRFRRAIESASDYSGCLGRKLRRCPGHSAKRYCHELCTVAYVRAKNQIRRGQCGHSEDDSEDRRGEESGRRGGRPGRRSGEKHFGADAGSNP